MSFSAMLDNTKDLLQKRNMNPVHLHTTGTKNVRPICIRRTLILLLRRCCTPPSVAAILIRYCDDFLTRSGDNNLMETPWWIKRSLGVSNDLSIHIYKHDLLNFLIEKLDSHIVNIDIKNRGKAYGA